MNPRRSRLLQLFQLLLPLAIVLGATLGSQRVNRPPEDAYRANNLGVAQLEQYNYDEAVKSFRRALDLSPDLPMARLNLSLALLYSGDADGALTAARQAQKVLPTLCQPHYAAGLALRSLGQSHDAVAEFKQVLELDSA